MKNWTRAAVALDDFFQGPTGEIYKVIAIADEPTVEIRDVLTGKVENYVISSRLFAEFKRLRPEGP